MQPWKSKTERDALLAEIIRHEGRLRVGDNPEAFRMRAERRIREELQMRSVGVIVIWWTIHFVAYYLIEEFFWSAEAEQMRSCQA